MIVRYIWVTSSTSVKNLAFCPLVRSFFCIFFCDFCYFFLTFLPFFCQRNVMLFLQDIQLIHWLLAMQYDKQRMQRQMHTSCKHYKKALSSFDHPTIHDGVPFLLKISISQLTFNKICTSDFPKIK